MHADIARGQPVKLEPRQPGPSQAYLDLEAWCAEHRPGVVPTGSAAVAAEKRLRAVQASLAPGFDPGRRQDGVALLRAYQQALEQNRPDKALAATYLALISTKPVTFEIVERTNALLCVSSTEAFARAVADQAEAERQQMSR